MGARKWEKLRASSDILKTQRIRKRAEGRELKGWGDRWLMAEVEAELGRGMAENGHGSELQAAAMAARTRGSQHAKELQQAWGVRKQPDGAREVAGGSGCGHGSHGRMLFAEAATSRGRRRPRAAASGGAAVAAAAGEDASSRRRRRRSWWRARGWPGEGGSARELQALEEEDEVEK